MESIDHECTKLKQQYETCFYAWYSENFLKGDTRDACEDLFQQYRACIDVRRFVCLFADEQAQQGTVANTFPSLLLGSLENVKG